MMELEDGCRYSVNSVAKMLNVTVSRLRHCYYRMNRPEKITKAELLKNMGRDRNLLAQITVIDDREGMNNERHENMLVSEIAEWCNEILNSDRPVVSYSSKYIQAGRPSTVNLSMFLDWKRPYKKEHGADLSHIPEGDLAHLSGKQKSSKYIEKILSGGAGTWESKNLNPTGFSPKRVNFSGYDSTGHSVYTGG